MKAVGEIFLGVLLLMMVLCMIAGFDAITSNAYFEGNDIRKRAITAGWAEYNSSTGDYEYTNKTYQLIMTGDSE